MKNFFKIKRDIIILFLIIYSFVFFAFCKVYITSEAYIAFSVFVSLALITILTILFVKSYKNRGFALIISIIFLIITWSSSCFWKSNTQLLKKCMFNEKNYYIEKHEFPQDEIVIKTSNNGFICNSVGKINVVNCETYSVISNINEIIINVSYGDRKEEYFIDKTKEIKEKITKNQDSNV